MRYPTFFITATLLICFTLPTSAADKNKSNANSSDANKPSYELPQPAKENLDLSMYQQIRYEGIAHSHVMEYASALMDGIGPRLTGSPNVKRANEWTRDQLTAMGCSNAHLEDWGEFGMGWQQLNTWVRMASPDTAVFIAQAAPWSPSSNGAISGASDLDGREKGRRPRQIQRQARRQNRSARRDARRQAGGQAAVRARRRKRSEQDRRVSAHSRARRLHYRVHEAA